MKWAMFSFGVGTADHDGSAMFCAEPVQADFNEKGDVLLRH